MGYGELPRIIEYFMTITFSQGSHDFAMIYEVVGYRIYCKLKIVFYRL